MDQTSKPLLLRPCPLWVRVDLWPFVKDRRIEGETGRFVRGNNEILDQDLVDFKGDLMTQFWSRQVRVSLCFMKCVMLFAVSLFCLTRCQVSPLTAIIVRR